LTNLPKITGVLKILEESLEEVSNRYSVKEAVKSSKVKNSKLEDSELVTIDDSLVQEDLDINSETALDNFDEILLIESAYTHSEQELMMQGFYSNDTSLNYEKLFSDDPEYMGSNSNLSEMTYSDTDSETLTDEEAEETMEDLQYASMLGTFDSVDFVKRRKLAMWADLNPVERELYHKLNSLTCNIDYSRTF
jgi:hypothetical protein